MSEDPEMTSVLIPLVADAPYLPRLISASRLVLVSWFKALQRETKGGTDKISSKIVHKIHVW